MLSGALRESQWGQLALTRASPGHTVVGDGACPHGSRGDRSALEALEVALQVLEHGAAIGVDLARERGDHGVLAAREPARARQLGEQDRLEVALDVLLDMIPAAQP